MLTHTDLKRGTRFIYQNQPYEILSSKFLFKGRGSSVLQARIKNLISGEVISKTFHPSDQFEEAEIQKARVRFLYFHRDEFWFCKEENPAERFSLTKEIIGENNRFLKEDALLDGLIFKNEVINVSLPVKIQLKVIEAPPGIKGDRAQGGTKTVTLETGAKLETPLFIKEKDVIEVNTESGEYVRRI